MMLTDFAFFPALFLSLKLYIIFHIYTYYLSRACGNIIANTYPMGEYRYTYIWLCVFL